MRYRVALVLLVAGVSTLWARAQPALGPEFQVNTYTTGPQGYPSVASDAAGNFVVVWESLDQDGSRAGVFAQRYDPSGLPRGSEFRVNTYTTGPQGYPSVASDAAGNFVVAWASLPDHWLNGLWSVFAQRYDATGAPVGGEFQVSTATNQSSYRPSVASDAAGNFVVAWEIDGDRGGYGSDAARPGRTWLSTGVRAQRYDAAGSRRGSEFLVNTYTTGDQSEPSVASDAAGNFVIVWTSADQDGDGTGVFAQRYDAAGMPRGFEFQVNTHTSLDQSHAAVAADALGNFTVAWQGLDQYQVPDILAQRYDSDGAPRGSEFRVNTLTEFWQDRPAVASDTTGNFAVVWQSHCEFLDCIAAQAYDASGTPLGAEFQVNSFTGGDPRQPSIASDAAGNLVVAWQGYLQDGSGTGVFARQFGDVLPPPFTSDARVTKTDGQSTASPGQPVTYVIEVSNAGPDPVTDARVVDVFPAQLSDVSWICTPGAGASCPEPPFGSGSIDVLASLPVDGAVLFQATGFVAPDAFGTLTNTASVVLGGDYSDPDLANNTATDTDIIEPPGLTIDDVSVVEGDSETTLGTLTLSLSRSIAGAVTVRYATVDGSAVAPEDYLAQSGVLTFDPGRTSLPLTVTIVGDILDEGNEDFRVVLSDAVNAALDDGEGVATILDDEKALLVPAALTLSPLGNGVWALGETASVQPSLRNVGDGTTGLVTGTAVVSDGGTALDAAAAYGAFGLDQTRSCTDAGDCYQVTATGPRTATHWDVRLSETLSTGTSHEWRLHVGDSFDDVPRDSAYFRFVETILHRGVTGGCAADSFCPANAVTREQVSVFVLVGKEGSAYGPPACTTPIFDDVPASSPFCRWIEELVRRGVVGGCGPDLYCPTNPVTREQMSVFLLRTLDPALDPPACATPAFADVPAASPFCRWIEELARRGITGGCGGGNYCPADPVTREQMAVFVSATFGLTLYGP